MPLKLSNLSTYKCFLALALAFFLQSTAFASPPPFTWPEGKKAAISLSFDDARLSNVDVGVPLFNRHGAKVTFYVLPEGLVPRLDAWKKTVADGHEIGNHTLLHPCSGNFAWSRNKALEHYTLASMKAELQAANQQIEEMLGVTPTSFAYTCGQTFVGRGSGTQSYVPLIAEMFGSGRGWLDEASNDPQFADLAQLQGIQMDGKDFEQDIKPLVEAAVENGHWLVLAGHEIGEEGPQTTKTAMLEALLDYLKAEHPDLWLAPIGEVANYVRQQRQAQTEQLAESLTFAATFDHDFDADFAKGDTTLFTAKAYDKLETAVPGMENPEVALAENKGRFGHALHFQKNADPVIFYQSEGNVAYNEKDWSGTISLWMSLDPEKDLELGYSDPIQITDVGYNDAALWVDFSDKNPRSFRMGLFGDLEVWNPENIGPSENPDFNNRLLPAKNPPFGRNRWTHVVVSFEGLNTGAGKADFYINGEHQGSRDIPEPFTWEVEKSKIFLGLSYIGMIDEVGIFNRALTESEIQRLFNLENGLADLFE